MVYWNPESPKQFERVAPQLSEVMIEWIKVKADGTVEKRTHGTKEEWNKVHKAAKKNGVELYAMASNFDTDFEPKRMERLFSSKDTMQKHIDGLVKIVKEDGFGGIDLDYESMKADQRDHFSGFVRLLSKRLKREKLKLSVTVHAKDSEPGNWDGPKAQDYKALGEAADVFRVMGYDYHWSTSDPGAISPDTSVETLVKFTVSQVPANKVSLCIAGYGYDWNKKPADSLTWTDWTKRFKMQGSLDPLSGEVTHPKAHFAGAESMRRKIKIAEKYQLHSVSLWYIGSEDPSFWGKG